MATIPAEVDGFINNLGSKKRCAEYRSVIAEALEKGFTVSARNGQVVLAKYRKYPRKDGTVTVKIGHGVAFFKDGTAVGTDIGTDIPLEVAAMIRGAKQLRAYLRLTS